MSPSTATGPRWSGRAAPGDLKSFETAGAGIRADGCTNVTLRNLKAKGFAIGPGRQRRQGVAIENCDFSDNYHDPDHGWGELPPQRRHHAHPRPRCSVLRKNKANRVWDGLRPGRLQRQPDRRRTTSPTARTSAPKMWTSCRNRFLNNNLSYGLRIDAPRRGPRPRLDLRADRERLGRQLLLSQRHHARRRRRVHPRAEQLGLDAATCSSRTTAPTPTTTASSAWSPGNTYHPQQGQPRQLRLLAGRQRPDRADRQRGGLQRPARPASTTPPKPGFGHGGIVIVGGPSSHTVIDGNHCHHNNGAGIVFRGDGTPQGRMPGALTTGSCRTTGWTTTAGASGAAGATGSTWRTNPCATIPEGNLLEDVTQSDRRSRATPACVARPSSDVHGAERAVVGQPVAFDASAQPRSRRPAALLSLGPWRDHRQDGDGAAHIRQARLLPRRRYGRATACWPAWRSATWWSADEVDDEHGHRGPGGPLGLRAGRQRRPRQNAVRRRPPRRPCRPQCVALHAEPLSRPVCDRHLSRSRATPNWDLRGKRRLAFWLKRATPTFLAGRTPAR